MTRQERFVRNYIIAASVGVGAFIALAAAEGLLVVGIVVFVVVVLSFAAVSYWLWTDQRRGEMSAEGTPSEGTPTYSKPNHKLIAGGLLNVAFAVATIALVLTAKTGLAIVTGLVAVATAAALARSFANRFTKPS